MKPPFPAVIDNSMMSDFRLCGQKANLGYFQHWKKVTGNVHLVAGAAYACGLEEARTCFFQKGMSEPDSIAYGLLALVESYGDYTGGEDTSKSFANLCAGFEYYFSRYPLTQERFIPITTRSGSLGVEFSFAEPLDILHPETGEPLLYSGRFDVLGTFNNSLFGLDDKTCSQLGATWVNQWNMHSQFTGYAWGARRAGYDLKGFLIRGLCFLKNGFSTAEALTYRPEMQVDRWYAQLLWDIQRMIDMWKSDRWSFSYDSACNMYSGCQFREVCLARNPLDFLTVQFEQVQWDPVTRTNVKIEVL